MNGELFIKMVTSIFPLDPMWIFGQKLWHTKLSLEADFKRICLGDHGLYNMIWHPVKGFRGDKLARFRGIMGLFEQRRIFFNRYRKFNALYDEIVNFGVSSHDDCVDATVWLCNGLMSRGKLELEY